MFYQTNCTQATERAENATFGSWWPSPLTFKLVRARDQTHLPCEFGTNPFSGSRDISYTNKKVRHCQKQPYAVHGVRY